MPSFTEVSTFLEVDFSVNVFGLLEVKMTYPFRIEKASDPGFVSGSNEKLFCLFLFCVEKYKERPRNASHIV